MSEILTLNKNWEFSRLYKKGQNYVSSELVTYVLKNNKNNLCIGITTSKKIGNAVQRSRCRRIIRAALKNLDIKPKSGFDIVFVARSKTVYLKSTDIEKVMREHLQSAGVI